MRNASQAKADGLATTENALQTMADALMGGGERWN